MPYVITATRVAERNFEEQPLHTITRRAVATLYEAREQTDDSVFEAFERERRPDAEMPPEYYELSTQARKLPGHGGTIGPLPDGAVIEVAPITWASIMSAQVIEAGAYDAAIDAYNSFEAYTAKDG